MGADMSIRFSLPIRFKHSFFKSSFYRLPTANHSTQFHIRWNVESGDRSIFVFLTSANANAFPSLTSFSVYFADLEHIKPRFWCKNKCEWEERTVIKALRLVPAGPWHGFCRYFNFNPKTTSLNSLT